MRKSTYPHTLFLAAVLASALQAGAIQADAQTTNNRTAISSTVNVHFPDVKAYTILDDGRVIYNRVETMPSFQDDFNSFFEKNLQYPNEARNKKIEGRAEVQFIVNSDGQPSDFEILNSSGNKQLDKEAIRVVKSMKNWRPGMEDGNRVSVYYKLPVTFKLNTPGTPTQSSVGAAPPAGPMR